MYFIACSRSGNACRARRAVAEFESAIISLRNSGFRILRLERDKGDLAFKPFARACASRLCLGVRLGKFQLLLSYGNRGDRAVFRRNLICGHERFSRRARPFGRG